MLQYDFMRRVILIGLMVSLICSSIGLFLVLKRFSMVGDTLSHISLTGVAIGMVTGIYPIYTATGVAILASLGIEKLRKHYSQYAELTLSIFLAAGIGIASILINLFEGRTNGIMAYLFGSISLVTRQDLYIVLVLGTVILISVFFLYRGLFFTTFDEEGAKIAGVKVNLLNTYFSVLVAITITISMRIVGILLVSSLMVLPVASSLQVSKSFKQALFYSNIFGVVSILIGITISFYMNLAPGGVIVTVSIAVLLGTIVLNCILKKVRINS